MIWKRKFDRGATALWFTAVIVAAVIVSIVYLLIVRQIG
jgi:hypothetical protein